MRPGWNALSIGPRPGESFANATNKAADLCRGQELYARQGDRLGEWFLESHFSDIDSLELYAGAHTIPNKKLGRGAGVGKVGRRTSEVATASW